MLEAGLAFLLSAVIVAAVLWLAWCGVVTNGRPYWPDDDRAGDQP